METEDWAVTLVDTGENSMTGGRLKRVANYLVPGETFCLTYGDGFADIDITAELAFHRAQGRIGTVAAVAPPGRFGAMLTEDNRVVRFVEKPPGDGALINGGFFIFEPQILDLIENDATVLELEPLERLAATGQLSAYVHRGFWQPLDTLRDKNTLEALWATGKAPWRIW